MGVCAQEEAGLLPKVKGEAVALGGAAALRLVEAVVTYETKEQAVGCVWRSVMQHR